jgi:hypothetical protein
MPKSVESYSARTAEARSRIANHLADFFEASGVEYTCLAVVMDVIEPESARLAALPEYAPYNVHNRTGLNRAAAIIHQRWREQYL